MQSRSDGGSNSTSESDQGSGWHTSDYYHRRGGALVGVSCMLFVLCTAAVTGRFAARRLAKTILQVDDFIALSALIRKHKEVYEIAESIRYCFSLLPRRRSFVS